MKGNKSEVCRDLYQSVSQKKSKFGGGAVSYRFSKSRKSIYIIFLCLLLAVLNSCVTSRKVNYMQQAGKHHIPTYTDTLSFEDYRLRKGDRLYIYVYSIDEKIMALFNSGMRGNNNYRNSMYGNNNVTAIDLYTYIVDNDGMITFPTLDKVEVRGLTTREVKHKLEAELSKLTVQHSESMLNLSVEVQVVQRFFSVIGAQKSGRFPIRKEKETIFEALAQSGDIAEFGDRSKIHIVRELEDTTVIRTFDVRSEDIINSEFWYIEPNDVIYVENMRGYSFGMNHVATTVSIVASTLSFGVFIYTLVDRFIVRPIKNKE